MLAVDSVLDLAGKSKLSLLGLGFDVTSRQFDVSGDVTEPAGLATRCMVDGIEIAIETAAGAQSVYGAYQDHEKTTPVPLSGGWQGLMVTKNEEATASVLLSCKNWSPKEGSGILVTADSLGIGYYHASPVDGSDRKFTSDPLTKEERADLKHFAERSAARHGCGAPATLPS
ncbi:hypothetical protein ACFYR1_31540 [Streptomyces canus]|uniref:hypothetical protein n=1 Tax=Streptomyces canus TaxID=58343 RepID=UPI0036758625